MKIAKKGAAKMLLHELFERRIAEICDGARPHPSRETKTPEDLTRRVLAIE